MPASSANNPSVHLYLTIPQGHTIAPKPPRTYFDGALHVGVFPAHVQEPRDAAEDEHTLDEAGVVDEAIDVRCA